jgi:molybdopterin converting factor subunit 1
MRINVRLFARARDLAGTDRLELILPDAARVRDARASLLQQVAALEPIIKSLLLAIDGEYATDDTPLTNGCELAAFPPVSGG